MYTRIDVLVGKSDFFDNKNGAKLFTKKIKNLENLNLMNSHMDEDELYQVFRSDYNSYGEDSRSIAFMIVVPSREEKKGKEILKNAVEKEIEKRKSQIIEMEKLIKELF